MEPAIWQEGRGTGRGRAQDGLCRMASGETMKLVLERKKKKKPSGEKVESHRDVRWRCLNSRVQTFTKPLSQQLTAEDINWHLISV